MSSLVHGLLTNAPGQGGRGFRDLWLAKDLPWTSTECRRAQDWLRGLRPDQRYPDGGIAFGCHRFGGVIYAVAGTVNPNFAQDEHGRGGFLAHGVWAPLDESRPAQDFTASLLFFCCGCREEADRLKTCQNAARFDAYLDRCRRQQRLEMSEPDPARALRTDPEGCLRMLSLAAAQPLAENSTWEARGDLPLRPATASSVLPPRLRLSLSWVYGADQPAASVRMREASALTSAPLPRNGPGGVVLATLLRLLKNGNTDRLITVCGDWALNSWQHFEREIAA